MRLSRRDRAAMTLALEWIRVTPGRGGGPLVARESACDALRYGGAAMSPLDRPPVRTVRVGNRVRLVR